MVEEKVNDLIQVIDKKLDRPMLYYLDLCTRCGLCYDTCHAYQGIPKKEYSPVGRAEVVRKVFRKYFKTSGKIIPWWGDAHGFDDAIMDELREAAFSCTGCRRCSVFCPFGIDMPYILSIAKELLIAYGNAPEELVMLADAAVEKGKSVELFKDGFTAVIKDLEKDVQKLINAPSSEGLIPMEKKGASMLFVGLSGAHSIIYPAAILNAAKADWTLSFFEAVNFGYFAGDSQKAHFIAHRIINEAKELGVNEIVIVECGTAYRIPKFLLGPLPFKVSSIVEVIYRFYKEGRITLKEGIINEPVTWHDPCQLARNGGIYDQPREILRFLSTDFREMNPTRHYNWCCGGGGGLVALDNEEFRIKSGKPKKEQIEKSGAHVVATACENCHLQLSILTAAHNMPVQIQSFTKLAAENLIV